jgi:hypothetical protein
MDAGNKPITLRLSVLLLLILLHGGLILVFWRERPVDADRGVLPEVPTTFFFINPEPVRSPREIEPPPHRRTRDLRHRLLPRPDAAIASPHTSAPAPIDWSAEAHRSVSEMLSREKPDRATQAPSAPPASAPWDSRPLLESTGHGLKMRIPVEIPGHIIDHCFGNIDLGHDQTGHAERYQLGCALGKTPARGDLFDSLRKPIEPAK